MSKIVCTEYTYTSDKVAGEFDGYKIAVISDMHCKEFGKDSCKLIEEIDNLNPDIIITAGDMVSDHGRHFEVVLKLMKLLSSKYPVYYGCGNHEMKLYLNPITHHKYIRYVRCLKSYGIEYLNNRSVKIMKNDKCIRISGLNLDKYYFGKIWNKINMPKDYLNSLLKPCKDKRLELLIAHNPDYISNYSEWGADIVVSGHIHGGLVVLPLLGGVIAPTLRLFPYYDYGEYAEHDTTLYLSRGLGAHTIPIRINNPPEIMLVTLKSKKLLALSDSNN